MDKAYVRELTHPQDLWKGATKCYMVVSDQNPPVTWTMKSCLVKRDPCNSLWNHPYNMGGTIPKIQPDQLGFLSRTSCWLVGWVLKQKIQVLINPSGYFGNLQLLRSCLDCPKCAETCTCLLDKARTKWDTTKSWLASLVLLPLLVFSFAPFVPLQASSCKMQNSMSSKLE